MTTAVPPASLRTQHSVPHPTTPDLIPLAFREIFAEDGSDNWPAVLHYLEHQFRGVELANASVLEIGSGRGKMALYCGLMGARRVVSMEPEMAGSRSRMIEIQRKRIAQLDLTNIEFSTADFQNYDSGGQTFDVITSFASINHICESPHHALSHQQTFDQYLAVARKIHGLLNPGGTAMIMDACRYGFFYFLRNLGIRMPWRPRKRITIDWRIHQNPGTWSKIFREAGFSQIDISYPLPFRLRSLGPLVSNSLTNFFLEASFTLRCRK